MSVPDQTAEGISLKQDAKHRRLNLFPEAHIPPRSTLYSLAPLGVGTPGIESLTSYVNRLAQVYHVGPRVLVAQHILPHLSEAYYVQTAPGSLGGFGRTRSMVINGAGPVALDWAEALSQLTMRSDLRQLTLHQWAAGLPNWGLLHSAPKFCPGCYHQWRELKRPLYQPLLWTLQAVRMCLHHHCWLRERCPSCQKLQSALAAKGSPGYCSQCGAWLGEALRPDREATSEMLEWQRWVGDAAEELYRSSLAFGSLPWDALSGGIAAVTAAVGGTRAFGRLVNVPGVLFSSWQTRLRTPSLPYVLAVGYVLDLSPLQLMTMEPEQLKEKLYAHMVTRPPPRFKHRLPRSQGDIASIQAFLQAVLSGKTGPLPLRHVARHLGVGEKYLVGRFPQECATITARYLLHRAERAKQRVEQECEEVRQAVSALREQGVTPSLTHVAARLSNPNILRRPEAKATWRALRHEQELEL